MFAGVYYTVSFGPGEGSDTMEWEIELTNKEQTAYLDAVQSKIPLEDVLELGEALSRAYTEIEKAEINNACSMQDGYALACREKGESPFNLGWSLNVSWADPNEDEDSDDEEYTFTIHLSNGGDSEVDFWITDEEQEMIEEAQDNGDCFEDVEELADLYMRVMDAAYEKLVEDLELDDRENIDLEDLEYTVDF